MFNFLRNAFAIVGALSMFMFMLFIVMVIVVGVKKDRIPDKVVLELDLEKGIVEYAPEDATARMFMGKPLQVIDVVRALEHAAEDDRVAGLVASIGPSRMHFPRIQEIRDAIIAFRESGKPALAWSDTFGELGPGNREYYLATAFDKIYLQPSGDIGLTGLIMEAPFIKGTLDKLGVTPRMDHRHEYKNFLNFFTEENYTEAHREANLKLMESIFHQMITDVAEARKMTEDQLRKLVDQGPFIGREAVDAGLVDGLAYRDELYNRVEAVTGAAQKLSLSRYRSRLEPFKWGKDTVALIYGVGGVQRGENGYDPVSGDHTMGAKSIARAFRSAVADDEVEAIIFRINSPGGSYVASDTIWRETVRAKEKGKPVIVTMGDVAGSGGYFVAMAADKIVAQPATITGSIGVLGGKMLTLEFWKKLGVSWDEIHTSANSDMWSGVKDYSPMQWNRIQSFLDRVYADFTEKAAQGRNLPIETIHQVAKGRVWSGEDAKALGLVDELGGFSKAIELAKAAAGIPEEKQIRLKLFPKPKTLPELILEKMENNGEAKTASITLARTLKAIQPLLRQAKQLGLLSEPGILAMPETELNW